MDSLVKIKTPCPENWETMKIGLHSRFCDNCQKNVIDFTSKSREEILEYLLANYNKPTCGRVYRSQLDFSNTDFLITINALSKQKSNTNLAFYLLSMGTLILASCNNNTLSNKKNIDSIEVDLSHGDSTCDSKILTTDTPGKKTKNDIGITQGPGDLIMGEIEPYDTAANAEPYFFCEKMPEFPGGLDSLDSFIKQNLNYPEWEQKNKIEGRIIVQFYLNKKGLIMNPQIIKSVPQAKNFDKEVLRVISIMPLWIPGQQTGKKVDVRFTLPIEFRLQ